MAKGPLVASERRLFRNKTEGAFFQKGTFFRVEMRKSLQVLHMERLRSNQIDRPLNQLNRYLYPVRYFHWRCQTANWKVRAWEMIYNCRAAPFMPFSHRVRTQKQKQQSRFEELNGFAYHQHDGRLLLLHNLLIAGSMNGCKGRHQIR